MVRTLDLGTYGRWTPRLIYALAMRGEVLVDLPVADPTARHPSAQAPDVRRITVRFSGVL